VNGAGRDNIVEEMKQFGIGGFDNRLLMVDD